MRTERKLQMRRGFGFVIWVAFLLWSFLSTLVQASRGYDPEFLDAVIHEYANKTLQQPRTGVVYNISLPANFSGIEASIVRLRSSSFWVRGSNLTSFDIPPRIVPMPYAKRLAILCENLKNLSSNYYEVPGYRLVSPVVGFMVFAASNSSGVGNQKLNLSIKGNPILVSFSPAELELRTSNQSVQCVEFRPNGLVGFSNMTSLNGCVARRQGHFALVIRAPAPAPAPQQKKTEARFWKWWVVGFVGGFIVLFCASLIVLGTYKVVVRQRIKEMEKESEKGVSFDTIWIETSKMPSASMIRTQPILEANEHVP
ncbi:uncharacterized protein LOC115678122 [Syzygium oleosum]|uniref:uncharacterized protein LOC115678122 n=1 Tax=Syzygium oleosum TaxID=219896 RepID=UPI0011D26E52|nr:uncharacterized protein LOC115678122 [Syzygium oleosum]XP_056174253.1 uncharacterized protein LOC115678122 [Syzygium oleosum]